MGWISQRGQKNWRSMEFKMLEADLSKRRKDKRKSRGEKKSVMMNYECDLSIPTCLYFYPSVQEAVTDTNAATQSSCLMHLTVTL